MHASQSMQMYISRKREGNLMATRAAEMVLRCVIDGSLSLHDGEIERRPYHKNCGCALHKLKGVCCGDFSKQKSVSFPKKKPWPDCSLSAIAAAASNHLEVDHRCLCEASKTKVRN